MTKSPDFMSLYLAALARQLDRVVANIEGMRRR